MNRWPRRPGGTTERWNHPTRRDGNEDDEDDVQDDDDDALEWIRLALLEYDQIARLRNSQLRLANSASPSSSAVAPIFDLRHYSYDNHYDDGVIDERKFESHSAQRLSGMMARRDVSTCVARYHRAIRDVGTTHATLMARLHGSHRARTRGQDDVANDDDADDYGGTTRTRMRARRASSSHCASARRCESFTRHVELAERVIRTVMGCTNTPDAMDWDRREDVPVPVKRSTSPDMEG